MCAGCVTLGMGNPKLQVSIPDTCERLPGAVSQPAMREADNALVLLARHRAALGIANSRIDAKNACMARVRRQYGRGG